jgi:hypothetical protein
MSLSLISILGNSIGSRVFGPNQLTAPWSRRSTKLFRTFDWKDADTTGACEFNEFAGVPLDAIRRPGEFFVFQSFASRPK